jgi:hypothetical protein
MDSRGASIEDLYTQAYDNRSQQQSHINNKTTHTGRTYDLKTAINALSQSPDGDQVVCAGREGYY